MATTDSAVFESGGRNIGGLVFPVTISETVDKQIEVTDHPVQEGAEISDHARCKNEEIRITVGASESSPSETDVKALREKLLELANKREPIKLVTGKRSFDQVLITGISETTDSTSENSLHLEITLREIKIAKVQTASGIPASRQRLANRTAGGTKKKTGTKKAASVGEGGRPEGGWSF
jgi:hypothetical protein